MILISELTIELIEWAAQKQQRKQLAIEMVKLPSEDRMTHLNEEIKRVTKLLK